MTKRYHILLLLSLLLTSSLGLSAQTNAAPPSEAPEQSITLEGVRSAAEAHFPLLRQKEVMAEMVASSSRALKYVYIPQVSISGGANYLTDVPDMDPRNFIKGDRLQVAMPSLIQQMGFSQEVWDGMIDETMASVASQIEIPTIPKLQWGISATVSQLLWDGGEAAAHGRELRADEASQDARTAEVLREVRQAVTEIYFGLLKVDAQAELQQHLIDELKRQEERVAAAIANDVAPRAEADEVRVELLKALQSQVALLESRRTMMEALTIYTGLTLDETTEVVLPPTPAEAIAPEWTTAMAGRIAPLRPEHRYFDAQIARAEASYDRYLAGLVPQVMLYAMGAYSDPYPNLFASQGAHPFAMLGVSLRWTFGQLYGLSAQQETRRSMTEITEMQRTAFEQKTSAELAQARRKVEQYAEQMRLDEEIVQLRKSISDRTDVQVAEGVMTRRDALQLLTQYSAAEITARVHRIDYLEALYRLADLEK